MISIFIHRNGHQLCTVIRCVHDEGEKNETNYDSQQHSKKTGKENHMTSMWFVLKTLGCIEQMFSLG